MAVEGGRSPFLDPSLWYMGMEKANFESSLGL